MDWSKLSVDSGTQLFKVHSFMCIIAGKNFELEVNEYSDGKYVGYGEIANDPQSQLPTVNADSLEGCVDTLIKEAKKKA